MNRVYLYDGDFLSLIALIIECMEKKIKPDDIKNNLYQSSLLDEIIYLDIKVNYEKIRILKSKLSKSVILSIYYVFLSCDKRKEMIIFEFILVALKYKSKVYCYRNIDCVNETIKIARRVSGEAHKLKGFLRFRETKLNILFAIVNPTNNVLPILSKHFQRRLPNSDWIIKDENRNIYIFYQRGKEFYINGEDILNLNIEESDDEKIIEELWKTFHKTIAIKERLNKKCQMNFMPKKYWRNMIEMEEEV